MDRGWLYFKHRSCLSNLIKKILNKDISDEETVHFAFIDIGFQRLGYTLNFHNYINMLIQTKQMRQSLMGVKILDQEKINWFDTIEMKAIFEDRVKEEENIKEKLAKEI